MRVGSKGIATWLVYDIGFPKTRDKTNVNLPKIDFNYETKSEFLNGIIGSMGDLSITNEILLFDKDETFIQNIKELSEGLGYTPNLLRIHDNSVFKQNSDRYRLSYSTNEVKRMNLINPKHQRR